MIKGSQSTSFDHAIFNVSDVQDNHTILYFKNLNLNGNLINGLSDPVDNNDATNKIYVDAEIAKLPKPDTDVLKLDGSKAMTGNLDMDGHNILSVKNLTDHKVDDAYSDIVKDLKSVVNKEYLNQNFLKIKGNDYDLNQRVIKNSAPHDDGSYDDNTLVSKAFVDAEIAKLPKPDTDVLKLDGSKAMTGDLDMGNKNITNTNKITTKYLDLNGRIDMFNNRIIGVANGTQSKHAVNKQQLEAVNNTKADKTQLANYLLRDGSNTMTGDLNMDGKAITNIKPFVEDDSSQAASDAQKNDVINFGYFHTERGEIKRLISEVGYDALNRKNPDPMEDDIDMGNHSIINLKDPTAQSHAANKKFVDGAILNSNFSIISSVNDKIKKLEEKSIHTVNQENVFKKVMDDDEFKEDDDDIHKVGVQNKDFHSVNKKTYEFKIDYDSSEGDGEYSTRLSIDLIYLPTGPYTMVYEMYIDYGLTVDQIDASSGTLNVENINSKIDETNTRSIIHFVKYTLSSGFDDLDIDIKLKGKTDPQTTIYVVVYGVKGQVNNVPVNLWDRFYFYDNSSLKYEVSIDMNNKDITSVNKITIGYLDVNNQIDMKNKKIIRVGDGVDNSDAVNKAQLNALETDIISAKQSLGRLLDEIRNFKKQYQSHIQSMGFYYFTDQLKHNNTNTVKFSSGIDSHPFKSGADDFKFRILTDGHYQIIYTDFYKNNGKFKIHDETNGNDLFVLDIDPQSSWTRITINAIIPITVDNGFNHSDISLKLESTAIFDGAGYSTFYIKYLGSN